MFIFPHPNGPLAQSFIVPLLPNIDLALFHSYKTQVFEPFPEVLNEAKMHDSERIAHDHPRLPILRQPMLHDLDNTWRMVLIVDSVRSQDDIKATMIRGTSSFLLKVDAIGQEQGTRPSTQAKDRAAERL
ncbi:MAG: hypothetical protein Q9162_002739 [Coniocarpon cinnabarinum]